MIEVRLFAGLRQGRQKIYFMEPDSVKNVQDIMDVLSIQRREVNILLINGYSRINTFDALGIVENFVNGTDYGVVIKAATISEKQ